MTKILIILNPVTITRSKFYVKKGLICNFLTEGWVWVCLRKNAELRAAAREVFKIAFMCLKNWPKPLCVYDALKFKNN